MDGMDDGGGAIFFALADMDEWRAFWEANGDELGDEDTCFRLAQNCALMVGGGAAPLYRVGFID